jgi:hypothetical protein
MEENYQDVGDLPLDVVKPPIQLPTTNLSETFKKFESNYPQFTKVNSATAPQQETIEQAMDRINNTKLNVNYTPNIVAPVTVDLNAKRYQNVDLTLPEILSGNAEQYAAQTQSYWDRLWNDTKVTGANFGLGFATAYTSIYDMINDGSFTPSEDSNTSNLGKISQNFAEENSNFKTQYDIDNPIKSLLLPAFLTGSSSGWGEIAKSASIGIGTTAGIISQEVIITYATGGIGTLPALAANVRNIIRNSSVLTRAAEVAGGLRAGTMSLGQGVKSILGLETAISAANTTKNVINLSKNAVRSALSAYGESAFEAQETRDSFTSEKVKEFEQLNGRLPNEIEVKRIKDVGEQAHDARFILNFAALSVLNMPFNTSIFKQFDDVLSLSEQAAARGLKYTGRAGDGFEKSFQLTSNWWNKNSVTKGMKTAIETGQPFAKNILTGKSITWNEGFEEGYQFWVDKATNNYYNTIYNKGTNDIIDGTFQDTVYGLAKSFYQTKKQILSTEGLQNIVGGILGGTGQSMVSRGVGVGKNIYTANKIANDPKNNTTFKEEYDKLTGQWKEGSQFRINATSEIEQGKKDLLDIQKALDLNSITGDIKSKIESVRGAYAGAGLMQETNSRTAFEKLKDITKFHTIAPMVMKGQTEILKDELTKSIKDSTDEEFKALTGLEEVTSGIKEKYVSSVLNDIEKVEKSVKRNLSTFRNKFQKGTQEYNLYEDAKKVFAFHGYISENMMERRKELETENSILFNAPNISSALQLIFTDTGQEKVISTINEKIKGINDVLNTLKPVISDTEIITEDNKELISSLNAKKDQLERLKESASSFKGDTKKEVIDFLMQNLEAFDQTDIILNNPNLNSENQLENLLNRYNDYTEISNNIADHLETYNNLIQSYSDSNKLKGVLDKYREQGMVVQGSFEDLKQIDKYNKINNYFEQESKKAFLPVDSTFFRAIREGALQLKLRNAEFEEFKELIDKNIEQFKKEEEVKSNKNKSDLEIKKAKIEKKVNGLPDNLIFITHVTSDGNAKVIYEDNLLMPAGVSSTTGIANKESLKQILFDLAEGKSPHRGYLDLFLGAIDRTTLENTVGRTLQDKLENYIDENFIEDAAKNQLPSSLNIGYFTNGILTTKYDNESETQTENDIDNLKYLNDLKVLKQKIDNLVVEKDSVEYEELKGYKDTLNLLNNQVIKQKEDTTLKEEVLEQIEILSNKINEIIFKVDNTATGDDLDSELSKRENLIIPENIKSKILEVIDNKNFIKLTEDKKNYINKKTGKLYQRVTNFISEDKIDPNKKIVQSSLIIGDKVDGLVRDFFDNKLKNLDTYGVSDKKEIEKFLKQLQIVKENLKKRNEVVIANDIVLYNDEAGLAGAVDLLTYDNLGNIRIYDMKTMRGNNFTEFYSGDELNKYETLKYGKSKKQKHTEQISLYRILLNNTHGLLANTIGVMPIEVQYNPGDEKTSKLNLLKGVQLTPLDNIQNIILKSKSNENQSSNKTIKQLEKEIADLRAQEKAELVEKIRNQEIVINNNVLDETYFTDEEKVIAKEIYIRYNEPITSLIRELKAKKAANEKDNIIDEEEDEKSKGSIRSKIIQTTVYVNKKGEVVKLKDNPAVLLQLANNVNDALLNGNISVDELDFKLTQNVEKLDDEGVPVRTPLADDTAFKRATSPDAIQVMRNVTVDEETKSSFITLIQNPDNLFLDIPLILKHTKDLTPEQIESLGKEEISLVEALQSGMLTSTIFNLIKQVTYDDKKLIEVRESFEEFKNMILTQKQFYEELKSAKDIKSKFKSLYELEPYVNGMNPDKVKGYVEADFTKDLPFNNIGNWKNPIFTILSDNKISAENIIGITNEEYLDAITKIKTKLDDLKKNNPDFYNIIIDQGTFFTAFTTNTGEIFIKPITLRKINNGFNNPLELENKAFDENGKYIKGYAKELGDKYAFFAFDSNQNGQSVRLKFIENEFGQLNVGFIVISDRSDVENVDYYLNNLDKEQFKNLLNRDKIGKKPILASNRDSTKFPKELDFFNLTIIERIKQDAVKLLDGTYKVRNVNNPISIFQNVGFRLKFKEKQEKQDPVIPKSFVVETPPVITEEERRKLNTEKARELYRDIKLQKRGITTLTPEERNLLLEYETQELRDSVNAELGIVEQQPNTEVELPIAAQVFEVTEKEIEDAEKKRLENQPLMNQFEIETRIADIERRRKEEYNTQYNTLVAGQVLDNYGNPVYEEDKGIGANSLSTLTDKKYGHGHIRTSGLDSLKVLESLLDGSDFSGMFGQIGVGPYSTWETGKFIIVSNNINPTTNNKLNLNEIEVILNAGLSPFAQELANKYPNVIFKDFNGKKYNAELVALEQFNTDTSLQPTVVIDILQQKINDVEQLGRENLSSSSDSGLGKETETWDKLREEFKNEESLSEISSKFVELKEADDFDKADVENELRNYFVMTKSTPITQRAIIDNKEVEEIAKQYTINCK